MSLHYESLDSAVRSAMICELKQDQVKGTLYISPRLTEAGAREWPTILQEAFAHHDDTWIITTLSYRGFIRTEEQRRKPKGGFTTTKVPRTALETLAEGEFNRFYIRGLCADVIASGGMEVEVYRGKEVQNPRPESQAKIGQKLNAQRLLYDLRTSQGIEPALGLPPGPNSGLTVRRVFPK